MASSLRCIEVMLMIIILQGEPVDDGIQRLILERLVARIGPRAPCISLCRSGLARVLRPQYLVESPFEPVAVAGANDCLVPVSVSTPAGAHRQHSLRSGSPTADGCSS
jgi:hypothetical protein